MTKLLDAIRHDNRLAIRLLLDDDPPFYVTDVVGEFYLADGMMGWVSTAVVGEMYSGNPLHVREGRFVNIGDDPPWHFVAAETGKRIATVFPVEHGSEFAPAANDWHEWMARQTRDDVRTLYARMLNETFNVNFSTEPCP